MKIQVNIFFLLIFFFGGSISLADDKELKTTLLEQKTKYEQIANNTNEYSIYTDAVFKNSASAIDSLVAIFSDERIKNQEQLRDAGRVLLKYLQDINKDYYKLSFDNWLVIANILLEIDQMVSRGTGWGNLVIKLNIANKLLNRIAQILIVEKDNLDIDKLKQLLEIQQKLRKQLPDRVALVKLVLRQYGKSGFDEIESINISSPVYKEEMATKELLREVFNNQKKDMNELIKNSLSSESGNVPGDYISMYDNPIPWLIYKTSGYSKYSWELYLYSLILLDKGIEFNVENDLTHGDLQSLLKREYDGDGKYWMTITAIRYIERPKTFFDYLNKVKENYYIKLRMKDHESSGNATTNLSSKRKNRFSPHKLP
jgi:hypothetical protein